MSAIQPSPTRESNPRFWQWVGICTIGLAVLALLAARVPERFRLIGLFAVGFGVLAGGGMAYAAKRLELHVDWKLLVATAVLIVIAETGLTLEMWRLYSARLTKAFNAPPDIEFPRPPIRPPATGMLGTFFTDAQTKTKSPAKTEAKTGTAKTATAKTQPWARPSLEAPAGLLKEAREARQRDLEERKRFGHYLKRRLKLVADLSETVAAILWILEVIAGTAAGTWMFRRTVRAG